MNAITPQEHFATLDDWHRFMRPIASSVRNMPTENEFKGRVAAIASALRIPAAWLRQPWRQAEAMRKFQFWPAVADVHDLFEADLAAERESMARRIADVSHLPPPAPEPKTAEAIEAVKQKAAMLVAELRAERPEDKAQRQIRPAYFTDEQLLEVARRLAAQGNTVAAYRAAMLERKLGMDA